MMKSTSECEARQRLFPGMTGREMSEKRAMDLGERKPILGNAADTTIRIRENCDPLLFQEISRKISDEWGRWAVMHPFFRGRHYVEAVKKCRFYFLRVLYAALEKRGALQEIIGNTEENAKTEDSLRRCKWTNSASKSAPKTKKPTRGPVGGESKKWSTILGISRTLLFTSK